MAPSYPYIEMKHGHECGGNNSIRYIKNFQYMLNYEHKFESLRAVCESLTVKV